MRVARNWPWLTAVFVTATLIVGACAGDSESERDAAQLKAATTVRIQPDGSIRLTAQDRSALGLETRSAAVGDLPDSSLRFGRVVSPPGAEARVATPITGRVARAPLVQLGQHVAAGEPLLEIQPTLDVADGVAVQTQAAQRQGDIDVAQREVQQAQADAERARMLSPQVVSAAQLQQAETTLATARARLEALRQARRADLSSRTAPVAVAAPIAGTIADLTATVGAVVQRGDVLATIVRAGAVWVDLAVPTDEPVGDRYEIVTATGGIPASLIARGRVSENGATRNDRLAVAAVATLTAGSEVSVRVGHGTSRGIVVPESALVPGVEADTIFVEASPDVFVPRTVQVAGRYGHEVRLGSGLTQGERIVVRGAMALQGELLRAQLRPEG